MKKEDLKITVPRQEGYYWIKFNHDSSWDIMYYDGKNFKSKFGPYPDSALYEIDERQIVRP